MHIYLALAALAHVQSFLFVAGAPLTATPLPSIVTTNSQAQSPSDHTLVLTSSALNGSSSPSRQSHSAKNLSNHSNVGLTSPQDPIPYHVKGTRITLLFHSFGTPIPSSYMLECLSLSLSLVLEVTFDGKGKDLITNGYFTHRHLMPNDANVTITVADFREIGKPMNYYNVRDVLSGIGEFITEPDRGPMTLSYEVDLEEKGYVGTGHVGYEIAPSGE